jgi:hypothetical protein
MNFIMQAVRSFVCKTINATFGTEGNRMNFNYFPLNTFLYTPSISVYLTFHTYFLCAVKIAILTFGKNLTKNAVLENRSNYLPN